MIRVGDYWLLESDKHQKGHIEKHGGYQQLTKNRCYNVIKKVNKPTRVAIDAGANVGLWSKDLCERFEVVFSIEPNPECIPVLEQNVADNAYIINCALGSKTGKGQLHTPFSTNRQGHIISDSGSSSMVESHYKNFNQVKKHEVNVQTIDGLEIDNIDFIKIDTQGYELDILKGATQALKKSKPVICVECISSQMPDPTNILTYLHKFGYMVMTRKVKDIILTTEAGMAIPYFLEEGIKKKSKDW